MKALAAILLCWHLFESNAQIPVELFVGHERATTDVMFFHFFQKSEGKASKWLFFNRNRAVFDYRQTANAFLPQFGATEALSWNSPALKGVAPVAVLQWLNRGIYAKTGLQYYLNHKQLTLFTWSVAELRQKPNIDHFLLLRYEPKLREKLHLFSQLELVSAFPTDKSAAISLVQRMRLGLKRSAWQAGLGLDFSVSGRHEWTFFSNNGVFLRHVF